MTSELIIQYQEGNSNAILELIKKFEPLLKKNAHKLAYDDAYDELLISFIEAIHKIKLTRLRDNDEGTLIAYICKSIHYAYKKSQKKIKNISNLMYYILN